MTKKTDSSKAAKPKAKSKKRKKAIGKFDTSVLARYSPTDEINSHPDWVKEQFPSYISPHTGHEATAIREFSHDGHKVKITTTYQVEVDGQPVRSHFSVDEDGRVYTHATPFVTYASAIDLMKAVIDFYPDSFSDVGSKAGNKGQEHGHGRHS